MIQKRTTLVLGAGASVPYAYPSGSTLIENIVTRISQRGGANPDYYHQLRNLGFDDQLIENFVSELRLSKVRSIDAFLEHRKDYREIGKISIAQSIIGCEQGNHEIDPLFHVARDPKDMLVRWYPQLLAALECELEQFLDNQLSIVTFNYDRSLEHFLYKSLVARYGPNSEQKVVRAIRSLNIIHVHGKLGNLPWESQKNIRAYGEKKNLDELKASGELISVLYEGDRQNAKFMQARELINSGERLFFLGFGYHSINLQRLGIDKVDFNTKHVLGTRSGIEELEARNIGARWDALRKLPDVPDVMIHQFLRRVVNLDGDLVAVK